jgi:hypothetical protein
MDRSDMYRRLKNKYGFREVISYGIRYLVYNKQAIVCDVDCKNPFMIRIRDHFKFDPIDGSLESTYGDLYAITDEEGIDKRIEELFVEYEDCLLKRKMWLQNQKENKIIDMFE